MLFTCMLAVFSCPSPQPPTIRSNAAVALKEVEMLREAVQKQQAEIATKTQEFEDARKRFSQVRH